MKVRILQNLPPHGEAPINPAEAGALAGVGRPTMAAVVAAHDLGRHILDAAARNRLPAAWAHISAKIAIGVALAEPFCGSDPAKIDKLARAAIARAYADRLPLRSLHLWRYSTALADTMTHGEEVANE